MSLAAYASEKNNTLFAYLITLMFCLGYREELEWIGIGISILRVSQKDTLFHNQY